MTAHALPSTISDEHALRRTLGAFPTGVAVITTINPAGEKIGLTCNSFSSVSLAPPLISWSIIKNSRRAPHFLECKHFAVSILADGQEGVARAFAKSPSDGFAAISHYPALSKCPKIAGAAAVLDCSVYARYEIGDHVMFIGYVQSHDCFDKAPLTFFRGQFGSLPDA